MPGRRYRFGRWLVTALLLLAFQPGGSERRSLTNTQIAQGRHGVKMFRSLSSPPRHGLERDDFLHWDFDDGEAGGLVGAGGMRRGRPGPQPRAPPERYPDTRP